MVRIGGALEAHGETSTSEVNQLIQQKKKTGSFCLDFKYKYIVYKIYNKKANNS